MNNKNNKKIKGIKDQKKKITKSKGEIVEKDKRAILVFYENQIVKYCSKQFK